MDLRFIFETINSVKHELYQKRFLASFVFVVVTCAIVAVGFFTPKTYTSSAMLVADVTNILDPILGNSAAMARTEHTASAREIISSRSVLEAAARESGLIKGFETDAEKSFIVSNVARSMNLRTRSGNYIEVNYRSDDPNQAFRTLNALMNEFLDVSQSRKRSEAQSAFDFTQNQVNTFEAQLRETEQQVEAFKSNNTDGQETQVLAQIQRLERQIEDLELDIEANESTLATSRQQLNNTPRFNEVAIDSGQSASEVRLANLQQELDSKRLLYFDTHPDIVTLLDQIAKLEEQIASEGQRARATEQIENPIYNELTARIASTESRLEAQRKTLVSLNTRLEEEFQRKERIAANASYFSELMRDYDVIQRKYTEARNDLEKARTSLTLEEQGQGVNYRIHETANLPNTYDGLQLKQFTMAAPVLAFGLVIGLITMLVLFDSKIRSPHLLRQQLPSDIQLLGAVPHYNSTIKARLLRTDIMILAFLLGLFLFAYACFFVFFVMGVEPSKIAEKLAELMG
ncbi:Wzz/FepE/Etk N-terminal domain-containing protein [Salinibius halmophilus]|uniref:Wzz/FepE/Etk N-terminal domain-containing protein n=1 Tax=Salinibius halmophilus TaxID=1853216 RepID=UPI000E67553A|nr:Wzz/FepE/Etk N-terminal domain-containing protein [Salinibius halmophilus]